MSFLQLENIRAPQPSTQRNFTTHLSYDEATNAIAYPCGKCAFVRPLDNGPVVQFMGHGTANVTVVKFSPIKGSGYVCSGDDSGKVIVWGWSLNDEGKVETAIKSEFHVLAGPITDVSWDFEGHRLCVVGEGRDNFGAFISWDSGNSLGEISGHSQRISACDMKQSRPMRCMTVGDDGAVVFYQGPPFKFTSSDRAHHDQGKFIRDVKFSPQEGKYAITVGSDRQIVCFDGKTGEFVKYIKDDSETVQGGFFALSWVDTTRFVTASADATIRLWDVEQSKCLQKWVLPQQTIGDQQVGIIAAANETVISLSLDGTLNFFQIGNDGIAKQLQGHNKGITALAVDPLISGSYDGKLVEWQQEAPKIHQDHTNLIVAISNKSSNKYATVSWDDTMKLGDDVKYKFESQPKVAATSEDGSVFAIVTTDSFLLIMDCNSGSIMQKIELKEPASALCISKNLVAIGREGSNIVQVFTAADLQVSFELKTALRAKPSCVSISPSGKYLAAGDVMGKILLFDLDSKDVRTSRWSFHTSKINAISWQPVDENGEEEEDFVATGSLDTNIFIYSVKKPMRINKTLNAHKDGVNVVQWQNKETLISAGADACIKTWSFQCN